MRTFSVILLLVLLVVLAFLAYENNFSTTISAWRWSWEVPFPAIVAVVYVLGMLTGWSMIAWMRRSWARVTEERKA